MRYATAAKMTRKAKNGMEKEMLNAAAKYRDSRGPDYKKKFSFDHKQRHRLTEYPKSQAKKAKFDMALLLKDAALIAHDKSGEYTNADRKNARNWLLVKESIDFLNKIKKKAGDRYE